MTSRDDPGRPPELDINTVGIDFLRTELDTGLMFASIASEAGDDSGKRDRNRHHALRAYDALVKFMPRVALTTDETREFSDGIAELRDAIAAIPT